MVGVPVASARDSNPTDRVDVSRTNGFADIEIAGQQCLDALLGQQGRSKLRVALGTSLDRILEANG